MKTNKKIAIIGAGIAGLTAALKLKDQGYNNITIFEARDRIGGKVCSYKKDGCVYELGAITLIKNSRVIENLLKRYKGKVTNHAKNIKVYSDGNYYSLLSFMKKNTTLADIVKCLPGVMKIFIKYKNFKKRNVPGFNNADPGLYINFFEYLKKINLKPFTILAEPASAGFGYGHIEKTPALYYLKMIQIGLGYVIKDTINSSFGPKLKLLRTFDNGYQAFLERIAKDFNVKLNSKITGITREKINNEFEIKITANKKTDQFDSLIITSEPLSTMDYLDLTDEEKNIFSKVKHYDFHITLFNANLSLKSDTIYFDPKYLKKRPGFPGSLTKLHRHKNIYQSYQMHEGDISQKELHVYLNDMAKILGGAITEIIITKKYKYFPHFLEEDLKELKPYESLDRMQGEMGTCFLGGLFNFEGTEQTAEYAEYIINKYF